MENKYMMINKGMKNKMKKKKITKDNYSHSTLQMAKMMRDKMKK